MDNDNKYNKYNKYTKYTSTQGMNTKLFGPSAWIFLFSSIMGRYPVKIDSNNTEHLLVKETFKNLFKNMDIILPCIFCRNSWTGFYNELPIEPFLVGRIELMFWLYKIKDKVNTKLLVQESKCRQEAVDRLDRKYAEKKIDKATFIKCKRGIKSKFKTTPTPPFKEILDFYENRRGKCNTRKKTC